MRLAIFTHVLHRENKGRYHAYSPYVREMNLWFKYAERVEIIAPRAPKGGDLSSVIAYEHSNIIFISIPAFNLLKVSSILNSIIKIPFVFFRILRAMHRADHLHLRCPGNIGLLAAIAQVFFPKKPKSVKYAGNWDPKAKQPWTYRLQKWILSNGLLSRNIKVLVYGNWPNQSDNIVPFFTASFSEKKKVSISKDFKQPYKFIFTGNLVEGKGVFEAIDLIESLKKKGVISELDIYGDGVLEDSLRSYIQKKELQDFVTLKGRKSLEELKRAYKNAHFVVLLSNSEGWSKALAEGMWNGCIPVATPVSCVPWMLKAPSAPEGGTGEIILAKRGILLNNIHSDKFQKGHQFECSDASRNLSRTVSYEKDLSEIINLIENPEKLKQMSFAAQEWSQQYTLERFEKAIGEILGKQNSQVTTDNRQPTTDNVKQHTSNNKPKTENSELTTDNKHHITNHKQLRILQLIDTLNPGGAERMAVNIANALATEIEASFLVCTRQEGMLKKEISKNVGSRFLGKKHSLDLREFIKLRSFVKKKKINIIHAHGTSWFWGVLLKLSGLKIRLIWHNHSGANVDLNILRLSFLKTFSRFFDGIISVNDELKLWAQKKLRCPKVIQLNNFISVPDRGDPGKTLKGQYADFKIVCVANLRPEKDQLNLINAFEKLDLPGISLHLIGANPQTTYSKTVIGRIQSSGKKIFYYGSQHKVSELLRQADLGVLSSRSEGLPLALLEYALAGLPVVCTNVGQCKEVTGSDALIIPAGDAESLSTGILEYYKDKENRERKAISLQNRVKKAYLKEEILPHFLDFYNNLSRR